MTSKEIINWRKLSEYLTGNPDNIRSNRIPKKYKAIVAEFEDLIEYWKKRKESK